MMEFGPQELIERLQWRYAVKRFDATRTLDQATWQALEASLVLTPSSYGLQPWRFVVVTDPAIKAQLPAISWNQQQPQDCSHMICFAARKSMDEAYVNRYIESVAQTRGLPTEAVAGYRNVLLSTVNSTVGKHLDWNARQVYIALGQLMAAAAVLHVDACPMEGIDTVAYDKLLGLSDTDYTCVVGCALGYRHAEDKAASAAKVRFAAADVVVHVKS
jgi:nitroreductase